jgi:hypothetical protein
VKRDLASCFLFFSRMSIHQQSPVSRVGVVGWVGDVVGRGLCDFSALPISLELNC